MICSEIAIGALLAVTQSPNANPDFDWKIASGEIFVFNTVSAVITSSPPQFTMVVTNGLVSVRDFTIEDGGRLVVVGPNPMVLNASGQVLIDGTLSIDGTDNPGVLSLNTTSFPEAGAPGQGGGGSGGTGSPLTTVSSPRGGNGLGAFGIPNGGGEGGETGWSLSAKTDERRGAGGGGGKFGANQRTMLAGVGPLDQAAIGLDAEPGFSNLAGVNGALSGPGGPLGGRAGPGPFHDGSPRNDFFGHALVESTGKIVSGELRTPWAGAGGGAGGDASRPKNSNTFPGTWAAGGDEKGAGGGGGAGSLRILSMGPIVFGPQGRVTANGGNGGGGENTLFLNRVGGGSGGASGGHIILESAEHIDLSQVSGKALLARGGQGGVGKNDVGGASFSSNGSKQTTPKQDACPPGYPTTGPNACLGPVDGAGGDGGPGVIQLHTPQGLQDILLAAGASLADLADPRPVCWTGGCRLLLSFDTPPPPARVGTDASSRLDPTAWTLESLRVQPAR